METKLVTERQTLSLEGRTNLFFQTSKIVPSAKIEVVEPVDYRSDNVEKPFAVNYFRTPKELPLDWLSSMETGTSGSIYQKDD